MITQTIDAADLHRSILRTLSAPYTRYFDDVVRLGLRPLAAMPASIDMMALNLSHFVSPALVATLLRHIADNVEHPVTDDDAPDPARLATAAAIYTAIEMLAAHNANMN